MPYAATATLIILLESVGMNMFLWDENNTFSDKIVHLKDLLDQTQKENAASIAIDRKNLEAALSAQMKRIRNFTFHQNPKNLP